MIASEYIFFEDLLWDALNARLFLLVTKENTSVEWKQAIGCRVAQVASKWCYTHGRVWNKDGPKYSDCLKFPKTPFSHLWSALQCALCILEIVFSFLHSECFFLQIASILSWTKWSETKFVLLWLFNSSSSLLRRQATRIWCSIRSGCWPESFATNVFSPPQ